MASNLDRLEDAGLILKDLPDAYVAVVEGLTDDEVDILVAVKRRLDEADATHFGGVEAEAGALPSFTNYVVF